MADDERWHVYVMPAQPVTGAVWSGSFAAKPGFTVRNGVMHIIGDDSEPEVIVSLSVAMSILLARQDYITEYQPKDPLQPAQQPETMGNEGF